MYARFFLDYNIIFNAFKPNVLEKITSDNNATYFHNLKVEKIGRKKMMFLTKKNLAPTARKYWEEKHEIILDEESWIMPFKCTKEVKLQNIQYKVNHNIFPTAILLNKMKIKQTDLCTECNEKETAIHFFFECSVSKPIWTEIEKIIKANTGVNIKLKVSNAMFGFRKGEIPKKNFNYINCLMMLGKLCISKLKYGPQRNNMEILESELQLRKLKPSR